MVLISVSRTALPVTQADIFDQSSGTVAHHTLHGLVCIDTTTSATFCAPVARKVDDGGYTSTAVANWITVELGCPKRIFQTEEEPAVMRMAEMIRAVAGKMCTAMTLRQSAAHSSLSDGAAERGVQSVRGLTKTLMVQVSEQTEFDETTAV